MVSIVGKSDLAKMSSQHELTRKLQTKTINKEANELLQPKKRPKTVQLKGRASRPQKPNVKLLEYLEHKRAEAEFNEYKMGIREVLYWGFSRLERNDKFKEGLNQKLHRSGDIKRILDNKMRCIDFIENETVILGLTVLSKILENRSIGGGGGGGEVPLEPATVVGG